MPAAALLNFLTIRASSGICLLAPGAFDGLFRSYHSLAIFSISSAGHLTISGPQTSF